MRAVDDRPLKAVANDHSQFWLLSHPASVETASALACAHISEVESRGWTRSIGVKLNSAVAGLDWLGIPPSRSVTAGWVARAEEVYVVVRGSGILAADGRDTPVDPACVSYRGAGDAPVTIRAGDEPVELLVFGTAIPGAPQIA